jgi:2-polyprenyl-3-methyl-5-hydroxy-6-metoxy-1,4-benzoquinol methylase
MTSRGLATDAEHRLLAWPSYENDEDFRALIACFLPALLDRPDVCLCLRHDPTQDPPLSAVTRRVEEVLAGAVGTRALNVLIVDDHLGDDWVALGAELSGILATPSRDSGRRRQPLEALGVPILSAESDLRECIGAQPRQLTWQSGHARVPLELVFDQPTVLLVEGEPGSGKTLLAQAIRADPQWGDADPQSAHGSTDHWYIEFVREVLPETIPGRDPESPWRIRPHYFELLSDAQRAQVRSNLVQRAEALVAEGRRRIVIEGWHLGLVREDIVSRLSGRANVISGRMIGHTLLLRDGHAVHVGVSPLVGETEAAFARRISRAARRGFEILRTFLRLEFSKRLAAETPYQTFAEYGGQTAGDSLSWAKLACLRLPAVAGMRALDVGCNAGYFSLKLREMGAEDVLGLDVSPEAIATARRYRDHVFELSGVSFEAMNAIDLPGRARFDLILTLSVFHYFRERQQEFLDRMHELLRPGGLLILEAGVSQKQPGEDFVEHYARFAADGTACHFPNRTALARMTARFGLEHEGPSVAQIGDLIPRFVFHLRKR